MMLTKAMPSDRKERSRYLLTLSLIFTFLWGLVAHGYMFLSNSISHDSIDEFLLTEAVVPKKVAAGRIFVPVMGFLRGSITAPWLVGLIGLVCIGLAVYFVIRIFEIENKWTVCLIAGILTVNPTVIALAATYMHDFDCDSMALLCAVLAVFFWKTSENKDKYIYIIYGGLFVMFSLGLYQSYISVTITLIVICCILWLLEGRDWKEVLVKGMKGIAMLVIGGILYMLALKLVTYLTHMALSSGNTQSLDNMLSLTPRRIVTLSMEAWKKTVKGILRACSAYPDTLARALELLVVGISGVLVLLRLGSREIRIPAKILTLILFAFLPLGANVCHVLANGISHDLMYDAFWLVYLLLLLLARRQKEWPVHLQLNNSVRIISAGLVAVILWGNVRMANGIYTAKRFVQDANLSLFTRITYSMEQFPGYVPGETPVVFIGWPSDGILTELPEEYQNFDLVGAINPFVLGAAIRAHCQCYYQYVLMNPAVIASDSHKDMLMQREDVANMPAYPAEGSIAMVDGTLVVKLGQ